MHREFKPSLEVWERLSSDAQQLAAKLSKANSAIDKEIVLSLKLQIDFEKAIRELVQSGWAFETTFLSDIQYAADHEGGILSMEEAQTQLGLYRENPGIYAGWLKPRIGLAEDAKDFLAKAA